MRRVGGHPARMKTRLALRADELLASQRPSTKKDRCGSLVFADCPSSAGCTNRREPASPRNLRLDGKAEEERKKKDLLEKNADIKNIDAIP